MLRYQKLPSTREMYIIYAKDPRRERNAVTVHSCDDNARVDYIICITSNGSIAGSEIKADFLRYTDIQYQLKKNVR